MTLTGFDLCRAAIAVEGISAPEQSVLTTLAIMANGDAQCWPGIAGLVAKTKLSERTVQRSLQGLKEAGHINWVEKPGRGRIYIVHPRHSGTPNEATPATATPRQPDTRQSGTPVTVAPTPATVAPKQPRTTISQKTTSSSNSREADAGGFTLPADEWRDYEVMRRSIRKPMTDGIRRKAVQRLRELQADGYPPGAVLSHSTLNSYQGLFPPKDQQNGRSATNRMAGHDGLGPTARAALRVIGGG